ncbi:hypothetical protein FACS1894167_07780 [Synergistales bacterium]|nr:hypothetical protein FACS1894167_07780 [Synergistales bacterium]
MCRVGITKSVNAHTRGSLTEMTAQNNKAPPQGDDAHRLKAEYNPLNAPLTRSREAFPRPRNQLREKRAYP